MKSTESYLRDTEKSWSINVWKKLQKLSEMSDLKRIWSVSLLCSSLQIRQSCMFTNIETERITFGVEILWLWDIVFSKTFEIANHVPQMLKAIISLNNAQSSEVISTLWWSIIGLKSRFNQNLFSQDRL